MKQNESQIAFLDLPLSIRMNIYTLAGLTIPCPIDFSLESQRLQEIRALNDCCLPRSKHSIFCAYIRHRRDPAVPRPSRERRRFLCYGPRLPLELLLVSKDIHLETSSLFYGSNKFKLTVRDPSDLYLLQKMSLHTISTLRSIHIRFGKPRVDSNNLTTDVSAKPPGPTEILGQWKKTAQHLSRTLYASHLYLGLTCAWADPEMAVELLQSLEQLTNLRGCAVALGRQRGRMNQALTSQVRASLNRLLQLSPAKAFPFQRLPKELRLQILEESDLVPRTTPDSREVIRIVYRRGRWRKERYCCTRCNDCLENCCCVWRPGSFSLTCTCQSSPLAFFLTNRQFSEEAQHVFFTANLFSTVRPLDATSFLDVLTENQLRYIRYLQLDFRFGELQDWYSTQATKDIWLTLIERMKNTLDLAKLELRINLSDCNRKECMFTAAERFEFLRINEALVLQLHELHTLKKLFIYLGYLENMETSCEKHIMGPTYDSARLGKPAEPNYFQSTPLAIEYVA